MELQILTFCRGEVTFRDAIKFRITTEENTAPKILHPKFLLIVSPIYQTTLCHDPEDNNKTTIFFTPVNSQITRGASIWLISPNVKNEHDSTKLIVELTTWCRKIYSWTIGQEMTTLYGAQGPLPHSPKLAPRTSLDQVHIIVSLRYHVFLGVACGLTFELLPHAPEILELITIKINTLH